MTVEHSESALWNMAGSDTFIHCECGWRHFMGNDYRVSHANWLFHQHLTSYVPEVTLREQLLALAKRVEKLENHQHDWRGWV